MPLSPSDRPAILGGPPVRPAGPPDWPIPDPAVDAAIREAMADGSWGKYHGPHVGRLESLIARYHAATHVVLCSSGTAAVELALRGIGIGAGDEVILAAYDFKGNFQDVLAVGGTPVLVDVRPDNWNLDVNLVPAAIGPKTKAILVSHLHGGVVDMPTVVRIARDRGLAVIEDAAQMPGARIHGRVAGGWGDAAILSFGGSKLLTAGRGGALITSRDDIAQRVRLYTQRGNDAYPLSELQAAVLAPQWARLGERNSQRTAAVARLAELLAGTTGLAMFHNEPSDSQPGYYKVGFQYDPAAFGGLSRDTFAAAVRAEGIALDPGFRALHTTHSSRRFRAAGDLPNATFADERVLTLHHPVLLGSETDLHEIAAAVEKIRRHAADLS
ncbi:MAG: aminotransferase class V-fold PLP-dependent enzyme [Planctomycetia bacterium]|nr:aminotransferase class V-fold PLP-dependent enzyme [Planctomycetia bacterium]